MGALWIPPGVEREEEWPQRQRPPLQETIVQTWNSSFEIGRPALPPDWRTCYVLTMSISSYTAGVLIDRSVPAATLATWTGVAVLIPAALWAIVLAKPASEHPSESQRSESAS